jgi:hypothetical protein
MDHLEGRFISPCQESFCRLVNRNKTAEGKKCVRLGKSSQPGSGSGSVRDGVRVRVRGGEKYH